MKKILIITGGSLDYAWASEFVTAREYFYIIAVDSGYKHLKRLGLSANVVLGDFDSIDRETFDNINKSLIERYPSEKDYTDTELALLKAIDLAPDEIDIIAATGSRVDHFMNSVMNLKMCVDMGIKAAIYDKHNKIYILKGETGVSFDSINTDNAVSVSHDERRDIKAISCVDIKKDNQYGDYISLVPLTDINVTLEGFKYPLSRANVSFGSTLCQSNEIQHEVGTITLHSGVTVVCESKD